MGPPSSVVLDTNVVISGFLTPGNSREILKLAAKRTIFVFSSPSLEQELADKLRNKFRHSDKIIAHELATYRELVHQFVFPKKSLKVIKIDEADNRVLEAAIESRAQFIITGDKHLLELGDYKGIKILKPTEFLSRTPFAENHIEG